MLNTHIDDKEFLYRRVILNPNFWDFNKNQPSTAIFKDSNGASVDRQDVRKDKDIIDIYKDFEIRGIVKVLTSKCREFETKPIYKPVEENVYHCEIHESETKIHLSQSKAKKLRDNSIIIFTK